MNSFLISIGKSVSLMSRLLKKGHGSTWPGHIALSANKNFIQDILKKNKFKTILIAGTNGKTTTTKLIRTILEKSGKRVFQNESGANLLNGIASTLILNTDVSGHIPYDYAILEIDENSLPLVLQELTPDYLLVLNLFRDQLDRYGEVNTIAHKWQQAVKQLPESTTLVLNANDPQIAYLAKNVKAPVLYFGLSDEKNAQTEKQHAVDSTYCPYCSTKLEYKHVYFSHIGMWVCPGCNVKTPALTLDTAPHYPLDGIYNRFNTVAATLVCTELGISQDEIKEGLETFKPAFGRQETLTYKGRTIRLFLAKNPTSFNESLRTIRELKGKHVLIVLNDRIPDGRDVSWIWDIDFETLLTDSMHIHVSGDRVYDMAVRLKYAHPVIRHVDTYPFIDKLFEGNVFSNVKTPIPENETLYILPTYSAMLEVRKLITGRKIL